MRKRNKTKKLKSIKLICICCGEEKSFNCENMLNPLNIPIKKENKVICHPCAVFIAKLADIEIQFHLRNSDQN